MINSWFGKYYKLGKLEIKNKFRKNFDIFLFLVFHPKKDLLYMYIYKFYAIKKKHNELIPTIISELPKHC
jgi:hypothetical protein